jgi:hypothetical protein
MRKYFAVEILDEEMGYWVEVEISDNLVTADKLYKSWLEEEEQPIDNVRLVLKENLSQSK